MGLLWVSADELLRVGDRGGAACPRWPALTEKSQPSSVNPETYHGIMVKIGSEALEALYQMKSLIVDVSPVDTSHNHQQHCDTFVHCF